MTRKEFITMLYSSLWIVEEELREVVQLDLTARNLPDINEY